MSWEEHKQCAFDAYCKKLLKNEAINIRKAQIRRANREKTFSDLTSREQRSLQHWDRYAPDRRTFFILGRAVEIKDADLGLAIATLKKSRRKIILAYMLGLSDIEIAQQFNIPRSTIQGQRTSILKELRELLEDFQYEQDL